jgi:hypothetical protein
MPTWEQLTRLDPPQPAGHELGPVTVKAQRSPATTRLLAAVGKYVATADTVDGIMAGDLSGGADESVPCESVPGIPGNGLMVRSACLGLAANRARAMIVEATAILDRAIKENREGWVDKP